MGKTFDQSLIDTAVISMSMIDPEDMQDTTSEEFASLRRIQQGCHSELSNREDFPFNKYTKNFLLTKDISSYSAPEGRITEVRVSNDNKIYKLEHYPDIAILDKTSGMPDRFSITYNPLKINFYPIPDKTYNASVDYNSTKNVILENGLLSYTIEVNSTLKMPEYFQHLYFDALEYFVLYEYMRKVSNPRFEPTYRIFQEKWSVFLRGCQPIDSNTVFLI